MRVLLAVFALMFLIALPHFLVELVMQINPWIMLFAFMGFILWLWYELGIRRDDMSDL